MFSCFNLVSSDIDNDPPSIIIGGLLDSMVGVPEGCGLGVPGGLGGCGSFLAQEDNDEITGMATNAAAAVLVKRRRDVFFFASSESFMLFSPYRVELRRDLFSREKFVVELVAVVLNVRPAEVTAEVVSPQSFAEVRH